MWNFLIGSCLLSTAPFPEFSGYLPDVVNVSDTDNLFLCSSYEKGKRWKMSRSNFPEFMSENSLWLVDRFTVESRNASSLLEVLLRFEVPLADCNWAMSSLIEGINNKFTLRGTIWLMLLFKAKPRKVANGGKHMTSIRITLWLQHEWANTTVYKAIRENQLEPHQSRPTTICPPLAVRWPREPVWLIFQAELTPRPAPLPPPSSPQHHTTPCN